ncbi:hypothetical protein ES703_115946 [subsurface metagenome]
MAYCNFCFGDKSLVLPPVKGIQAQVCKGCYYKIDQVVGFLRHYGATITVQSPLPDDANPPNPPKSKKRAPKFGASPSA